MHFSLHWNSSEKQQPQTLLARRARCAATMDRQLTQQSRSINVRPPSRAFTAGPSTSFVRDESQDSVASAQPQEHSHACISPYDPDFEGIPDVGEVVSTKLAYRWRYTFWGMKGRILPDFRPVLLALLNSAVWILVDYFDPQWTQGMNISFQAISGLSFVMALLVSFRLRSAYARWYEGRMSWSTIGRVTRDFSHMVSSYLEPKAESPEAKCVVRHLYAMMIAFPILLKNCLRDESENKDWKELLYFLSPKTVRTVTNETTPPNSRWLGCLEFMRVYLSVARDLNLIAADGSLMHLLDDKVCALNTAAGACDRLKTTPLAYGYAIHIRTVLMLYFFFLPPLLISNGTTLGAHIIIMLVLSHALMTVDNLAVQVEMPFGFDILDLPLEEYCNQYARSIQLVVHAKRSSLVRAEIFGKRKLSRPQSEGSVGIVPVNA